MHLVEFIDGRRNTSDFVKGDATHFENTIENTSVIDLTKYCEMKMGKLARKITNLDCEFADIEF